MATDWQAVRLTVLRLAMADRQSDLIRYLESLRLPLVDIYEYVLQPAFGMIEDRWFASELTLQGEWQMFRLIERLVSSIVPWPTSPKPFSLLSCTVSGEVHDVGIRMIANLFDEAGWHIVHLGADAPSDMVLVLLEHRLIHAAAFSVTLDQHLGALEQLLPRIAALPAPPVTLVGGAAITAHRDLPALQLADLVAPGLRAVVAAVEHRVASRTFAPPPPPGRYPPCLPGNGHRLAG